MKKYVKLVKNVGLYAISSFGSKILTFLILPLYSFVLSTSEFGVVDIYLATINLLLPIISLSIFDAVFRFVVDADTCEGKIQFFQTGITFSIICTCASGAIVSAISIFAGTQVVNVLLCWAFLIMQMFISCLQQFARAIDKVAIYSISSIIYTFVYLACNVVFLVFLQYGVSGYLLSYVVAGIITCLYLIIVVRKQIKVLGKFRFSLKNIKIMLQYCIPLIPNAVLLWIMNAIDRWFIIYYCGTDSNGLYAFACKIPTVLSMIATVFFQAWQLSAIEETKEKESSFSKQVYSALTMVCYVVSTFILVLARPLLTRFTEQSYWLAVEYIPLLLLGVIFQTYASFYGTIYIAYKKTKAVLVTSAIGAAINVLGNAILVPHYGVQAACFTTMISYMFVWLIRVYDTKKIYIIKTNKLFIVISVGLMLLQTVAFWRYDVVVIDIIFVMAMAAIIIILERRTIQEIYKNILRKG